MKKINVRIEGTTPLLHNKPPEYEQDSNIKINNPNIDSNEEAKKKLYCLNGVIYQPATHIRGSLINAGKALKVKGQGKATYSKLFASMVEVFPEAIELKYKEMTVDISRTVNPNTKGANMTKRPKFKEWSLDFIINVEDEIPMDVLKEGLERAGKYVGIGDWRPATKGTHGKFMVTKFEKV